jgi:hypothetical protein
MPAGKDRLFEAFQFLAKGNSSWPEAIIWSSVQEMLFSPSIMQWACTAASFSMSLSKTGALWALNALPAARYIPRPGACAETALWKTSNGWRLAPRGL